MMHPSDIQWWKAHSADYVLGLLSNSERLVFERIMPIEPELQEFVVSWRERLQPMSDALAPIKAPDHILPTLISNIPSATDRSETEGLSATQNGLSTQNNTASVGTALVAASAVPDSANGANLYSNGYDAEFINLSTDDELTVQTSAQSGAYPEAHLEGQSGFQSVDQNNAQLNVDANDAQLADGNVFMQMLDRKQKGIDAWRSFAGLATVAGLLMGILGWMGFQQVQANRAEPTFDGISIVQNSDEKALWVVDSSAKAKTLRVTAVAPPVLEEGQVFEMWMVKPNDGGVVSMGLLPSSANVSSQFNAHRFSDDAESFGVSVESDKGSPESIPTGPILYKGKIQSLSD